MAYDFSCSWPPGPHELLGREGEDTSYRRTYTLVVPVNEADPEGYIEAWAARFNTEPDAPQISGYRASGYDYDETEVELTYEVEISWEPDVAQPVPPPDAPSSPATGTATYRFNFQAQGRKVRMVESGGIGKQRHLGDVVASGAPIWPANRNNLGGVVGYEEKEAGQFDVTGVQVEPGPETFSVNYIAPNSQITNTYVRRLEEACGTTNIAAWKNYAPGELLLVRVQGQSRSDEDWDIEFGFSFLPALPAELKFRDGLPWTITIPTATFLLGPHDLIWFEYANYQDNIAQPAFRIKLPWIAHLERVWDQSDYDLLNIPNWI